MARILKGEIYWADLNPVRGREQAGLRPVLILSQELFNRRSETVITMAITSQPQKAGFPLTFGVAPPPSTQAVVGEDLSNSNHFCRPDR
jgi:mRNA interferase MazF